VEFYNPDLYFNVARVYLAAGQRRKAWRAVCQGLRLEKRHSGLLGIMREMGVRRRPMIRFLPRNHLVNRLMGGFTSRVV